MFSNPHPHQIGYSSTPPRTSNSLDYRDLEPPRPTSASCLVPISRRQSLNQEFDGQSLCYICNHDLDPDHQKFMQLSSGDDYHEAYANRLLTEIEHFGFSAQLNPDPDQSVYDQVNASSDSMSELLFHKDRSHDKGSNCFLRGLRNVGYLVKKFFRPSRSIKADRISGIYQDLEAGNAKFVLRYPNDRSIRSPHYRNP